MFLLLFATQLLLLALSEIDSNFVFSSFQVNPQPEISAYREGSFGYGTLEIFNSSVALWKWHRNQDQKDVVADVLYLTNLHKVNCTKPAVPSWPTYAETATLQTTYCASD
ncbi:hypothetical protein O6H91_Y260800 [Diphasiastrum complanatum]|nr:hypothetical protein O6H91_Y260800 [Diphasiastrum complanatum]